MNKRNGNPGGGKAEMGEEVSCPQLPGDTLSLRQQGSFPGRRPGGSGPYDQLRRWARLEKQTQGM